ncbi:MAG: Gfo/Idh/MocA family protein [Vicinamibacterales bacterium]
MGGDGLRAAIVGCGRIAGLYADPNGPVETHAQAYWAQPGVRLVAVCDPNTANRERFAATWRAAGYAELHELLERESPDIVSICSPPEWHADHVVAAAQHDRAPRAMFVEKPCCQGESELDRIEGALAALPARPCVLVNHTRRFDPAHRQLAAAIRAGAYGRLLGGRADYYGGWMQNGPHLIDLLRMFFGNVTVTGLAPGVSGRGDDDCPVVHVDVGGARLVASGADERYYQLFELDLRFERARVLLEDFGAVIRVQPAAVNGLGERILDLAREERTAGLQEPLRHAVRALLDDLAGTTPLSQTGATLADARETMRQVWNARAAWRG